MEFKAHENLALTRFWLYFPSLCPLTRFHSSALCAVFILPSRAFHHVIHSLYLSPDFVSCMLSTIQQADREGTFFCFPADGAALQVFVFSYPLCTSGMAVERCSFSLGKCHAPSGMVGPLSDQFTLVMGYHHYGGGMWRVLENLLCELLFPLCF